MKNMSRCLVLLIPSLCYGSSSDCSTARVLIRIRPGAAWVLHGDSMKGLKWLDKKQSKPSTSEVEKARQTCITDERTRDAQKAQARLDLKNPSIPTDKKVQDLILLLDMDR